jgi:hypothetical protein
MDARELPKKGSEYCYIEQQHSIGRSTVTWNRRPFMVKDCAACEADQCWPRRLGKIVGTSTRYTDITPDALRGINVKERCCDKETVLPL